MSVKKILAILAFGALAAGCQTIPKEMTVGQYCANAKHANKDVCKINVEIDGTRKSLAETNMTLSEARAVADKALATANQALAREDKMFCETRTLNKTNIGSCSPGYTLVSCTQTRFTYRAGGPSIMREINDQQCRFNDRVLELQVRCCHAGAGALPTEAVAAVPSQTKAKKPPTS
jgi:hypothetical protein